jgi:DNA repair protein RecO (recombination protein O)
MLHKTPGIVINYIRYRESSILAKIYTEAFGIQTYIVNGVRSSKAKTNRIALFQPLTLLDMVVYHKSKEDTIHRLSEIKSPAPFRSIPFEVIKSSLALFLTEILGKTLREEENNSYLFQFLTGSILFLDEAESGFENFHIQFLLQYAAYLGFGAETIEDLETELRHLNYPHQADDVEKAAMRLLLDQPYGANVPLDRARRVRILEKLIYFYKIHLDGLGEIKSLEVLREVLR